VFVAAAEVKEVNALAADERAAWALLSVAYAESSVSAELAALRRSETLFWAWTVTAATRRITDEKRMLRE